MAARLAPDPAFFAALRRRVDPSDPIALTNLAWGAARRGALAVAQDAVRRAVALPGAPRTAWRTLERLAVGRSDGLLLAVPDTVTPADSGSTGSPLVAAVAAHRHASHAVAEACYHAALPEPRWAASAWNGLAVLHEQRGERAAADDAWQQALVDPHPASVHNRALAWIRRGELRRGRVLLAEHDALVTRSAPLLFLVGYAALLDDDPAMARLSIETAVALDPDLVRGQFALGIASERLGRTTEALHAIRRGLMMSPWFVPMVWLLDSGTGTAMIELADSSPTAVQAIARDDVLLVLGRSLLEDGHFGEALGVFDQVLLRDESHTAALFHRGVVLAKLRRYGEALGDWDQVLAITTDPALGAAVRRHAASARQLAQLFGSH
jgi:tetratricopeptide (TPR) repeat protein